MAAVALYYKLDPMQKKRIKPAFALISPFDDLKMTPASLQINVQ
jgi:hypothetical protein